MDLRKLLYFVTIVEEGQITRAAKKLHMAQPPLSLQLKALEEELGVTLIRRNTKTIELTAAGRTCYHRAKEILNSVDGMMLEIKEQENGIAGNLSIGTVMSCVSYLPKAIQTFQQIYPRVTFQLWEGDSHRVEELLQTKTVDLGITRLPIESENLNIVNLNTEPLVAVQPNGWNVIQGSTIHIKELKHYPLMVLHGQGGKGLFEIFVESCQNFHFNPKIICESPDVAALLTLVDSAVGIAIVPKSAIELRPKGTLINAEITPLLKSETALVWPKDRRISKTAEHFSRVLIGSLS
ncbi:LysR family transcriptional regulator [Heyndrickxia ginsengihumi]|uniref:LysR family transcriptional regulator n=1 Tax=Heyndrickxia ginsengihumi TaxID=363870 RepID=A0A0A6V9U2_9BACI|nr:LysR family transcriptional regulator [Heyndrickxia ginsengihumi]KHD84980.1 LysR family transcriptional regulator [Heyndrickxia ginsengihumi]MBE6184984.1 LysR family transcriptional regulator [Bacillus sp. (in: firmicutes)]MCM3024140.1 LysR family transcriptional regulator [Heyndrickxia ginsengihumi]NEY18588.1 LysR family transcriptional regulator [Heyndrickxia ginsengihumi]